MRKQIGRPLDVLLFKTGGEINSADGVKYSCFISQAGVLDFKLR